MFRVVGNLAERPQLLRVQQCLMHNQDFFIRNRLDALQQLLTQIARNGQGLFSCEADSASPGGHIQLEFVFEFVPLL